MKQSAFFGLVSNTLPLLASTSAYENIAIVNHYNSNNSQCNFIVQSSFEALGFDRESIYKMPSNLDERELFATMLLRACLVNGIVIIDRATTLLSNESDSDFLDKCVAVLSDFCSKISIFDTKSNMKWYKKQYD